MLFRLNLRMALFRIWGPDKQFGTKEKIVLGVGAHCMLN